MRDDKEAQEEEEEKPVTRGSTEGGRRRTREVVELEEPEAKTPRPRPSNIRHIGHGRLVIRDYHFNGHGAVVRVKGEDVAPLLAYERVQRTCCGPRSPVAIRPLVKA